MAKSFLPTIFEHPYEIDPKYGQSVAYFSMEYAIDNAFKIYSGGLGYLSGSHMRLSLIHICRSKPGIQSPYFFSILAMLFICSLTIRP